MTSPSERRALVVGTGLIGGSLGLALRRQGWRVSGWDQDAGRAKEAVALGALDAVGDDLEAQVAFVATPLGEVAGVARRLLADPERRPDLVVTDVAGVKGPVVADVDHPRFVGGHPMAGSELLGLEGADAGLFDGAAWVLTPTAATDLGAFERLRVVVASMGGDVVVLPPEDHDRLVAVVSHVPHLVAATLVNAASAAAAQDAALLRLAAGGFRDMTRVAAGHPGIWPDVCTDNARAIVAAFDQVLGELSTMRDRVAARDRAGLLGALEQASTARRHLPARGARPARLTELRVPVPDRPGVLDEITGLAAGLGANIYDIAIAHSAESARGVLLLVVAADDGTPLRDALAARGYHCTLQRLT